MAKAWFHDWSQTIGSGHLTAVVTLFVSDDNDYQILYGARLKFIDPNLNPPGEDFWTVADYIGSYKRTQEQVLADAMTEAMQFYTFITGLMTNYGNNDTITAWANFAKTLQAKLSETLGTVARLEKENETKTARIAELETDYVKKLETKIADLKQEREIVIGTLKTIVEGQKIINEVKAKKGPQW